MAVRAADIEEFAQNMKLKKKAFGGYDREDVILKIQDILRMVRQSEAESKEELACVKERAESAENQLSYTQQEHRNAVRDLDAMTTLYQELKAETEKRAAQPPQPTVKIPEQSHEAFWTEAQKLHEFLASIESARSDILTQYQKTARIEAQRIEYETRMRRQEKQELDRTVAMEMMQLNGLLDSFIEKAQQMKDESQKWGRPHGETFEA